MPPGGTLISPRIFLTRAFLRWNRKSKLPDATLAAAVTEMQAGLVDADLGGGVVKKRLALAGRGKRGGGRVLVATDRNDHWFFIFGYIKNERSEITRAELAALQKWASDLLALDANELASAVAAGELLEIHHEHPAREAKQDPGRNP